MFYDTYVKLCSQKGISPTKAAEEIGISRATPTTWKKRGLTPQGETLNKIASYFDVSIDYLIGIADFDTASTMLENEINTHLESASMLRKNQWDTCLKNIMGLKQALIRGVQGSHTLYQIDFIIDQAIDLRECVTPKERHNFLTILGDIEKILLDNDICSFSLQEKIRIAKEKLL